MMARKLDIDRLKTLLSWALVISLTYGLPVLAGQLVTSWGLAIFTEPEHLPATSVWVLWFNGVVSLILVATALITIFGLIWGSWAVYNWLFPNTKEEGW